MANQEKLLDQIQQLLERGLFFAEYSKRYKDLYDKKKSQKKDYKHSPNRTMICVQNGLYFNEALLNLETLFSREREDEDKEEISFRVLLKKEPKDSERYIEYEKIREEYFDSPLPLLRNKLIAHKDLNSTGDPMGGFLNPVDDKWLEKTKGFYSKLNDYLHNYFDVIENDSFEQLYKDSFDYLYKKLEDDER